MHHKDYLIAKVCDTLL